MARAVMDDVTTYSCVGPMESSASVARRAAIEPEHECPFVNRSDERCAEHKTLGGVSYAYDHCFDAYGSCPVYRHLASGGDLVIGGGLEQWRAGRPKNVEITIGQSGFRRKSA